VIGSPVFWTECLFDRGSVDLRLIAGSIFRAPTAFIGA
jgi:hypothetical protein